MHEGETDASHRLALTSAAQAFALEATAHSARLILEGITSNTEVTRSNVLNLQTFVTVIAVRVTGLVTGPWPCYFAFACLACQLVLDQLYPLLSVLLIYVSLGAPCEVRNDWIIILFTFLQLSYYSKKSNVLRSMALLTLYTSTYATSATIATYLCVLALELCSWATERYMLPWRLKEAQTYCFYSFRFMLGFVIGVHVVDVSEEEQVLMRPRDDVDAWLPTLGAVSIAGDKVFLRFEPTPTGILLAYLEGLTLFPLRFLRGDGDVVKIFLLSVNVADFSVQGWQPCTEPTAMAVASRFPVRRLVLGTLLRMVTVP